MSISVKTTQQLNSSEVFLSLVVSGIPVEINLNHATISCTYFFQIFVDVVSASMQMKRKRSSWNKFVET